MSQSSDISATHVPKDSISSLSMNGTPEVLPTLLVAGSWDASVIISSLGSIRTVNSFL